MNSYQKEVAMASLKDEAKILSELEKTYKEARKRIKDHVKDLTSREAFATESELRSIIYQKKYQNALDSQLKTILDDLKNNNYSSVNDYLEGSYRNGFMGSMYSLNKQGIPLILPINQSKVIKAITQDTKLSTSFYKKLGINMKSMKTAVRQEISRGISSGMSFGDIARNIDNRMDVGLFNTQRIARTEGHRVNMEAKFDCMKEAEKNGAEILKQWDSTLDNRTRPDHMKLDGQIRKLEDPFEVAGADGKVHKAMYPSQFNEPSEDINCRCVVLEIGKWEINDDNHKSSKYEDTKGIVSIDNIPPFKEYCEKYNENLIKVSSSQEYLTDYRLDYSSGIPKSLGKEVYDEIYDSVNSCSNSTVKDMWIRYESDIKIGELTTSVNSRFVPDKGYIVLNTNQLSESSINNKNQVIFHESAHMIDFLSCKKKGKPTSYLWNNGEFVDTIKKEVGGIVNKRDKELKIQWNLFGNNIRWLNSNGIISDETMEFLEKFPSLKNQYVPKYDKKYAYRSIQKELKNALSEKDRSRLSDILEGATKGKIRLGTGHGLDYWSGSDGDMHLATETFANITDSMFANQKSLDIIQMYLPKTYNAYIRMIKDSI